MKSQIKTFNIFHHPENHKAVFWAKKIGALIKTKLPEARLDINKPDIVITLGGDGTILEAARKYHEKGSVIFGLNLGNVGFLASAREEKEFVKALSSFIGGNFGIIERMMIAAQVIRKNEVVHTAEALNEIVVKNPLGMVELKANISGHPVQQIRGTGLLVSTATGSTAYNLSAHGPIVMPDIKCLIMSELLDHSIPSPSIVVKYDNIISIKVVSFRERGVLSLTKTRKKIEVLMMADGDSIFPLEKGDEVIIKNSPHLIKFAELEKNYFFKSLNEKFGFR